MTSHVARLYSLVVGILVFFLAWVVVAAHPWATLPARDSRLTALAARQQRIHAESVRAQRIVAARWRVYHRALVARNRAARAAAKRASAAAQLAAAPVIPSSAAPAVRVVSPPARHHEGFVMLQRSFPAMGTTVELFVEADDARSELDAAESEFERLEQVMSRFRPTSELSRLNDDGAIDASEDLAEIVQLALDARARSNGRFDVTVHDALVAAGYDRTFDEVLPDGPGKPTAGSCGGGVRVDGRRIALEPHVRLDLGGIGKGFAAERVATLLSLAGPCLVSAGGDIAVRGVPDAGTWPIAVSKTLTLGLTRGGVATSGRERRHWRRGGKDLHHLIDPATGRPVASDLLRVTVVGASAIDAEVLATSLFVGGAAEALAADVPAVLLTTDGRTLVTGGLI